jgi:hypothetical protein
MAAEPSEMSVSEARDHFSDAVNRAVFGGEITFVTRGRRHLRAAAVVPAELVERYEAMVDLEDARVARKRLADLDAGRRTAISADEVTRVLGLSRRPGSPSSTTPERSRSSASRRSRSLAASSGLSTRTAATGGPVAAGRWSGTRTYGESGSVRIA